MKILACSEWWNVHIVHLIRGLANICDKDEFEWTNKQWFRPDFLPLSPKLEETYAEPDKALRRLSSGYYDAAIFSDGTSLLYASEHLGDQTVCVDLDSTDSITIPRAWYECSDLYFKAQYPKEGDLLFRTSGFSPIVDTTKILPIPYPAFSPDEIYNAPPEGERDNTVFFSGWSWPQDRVDAIKKLANSSLQFSGGLYIRQDMPENCSLPQAIMAERLNPQQYLEKLSTCGICLNLRGNGWLTFRLPEIFRAGGFCISQPLRNVLVPEPRDGEEIVYCAPDFSDLVELCHHYIDRHQERKRIAQNARAFYELHWSTNAIAEYFLKELKNYVNNNTRE